MQQNKCKTISVLLKAPAAVLIIIFALCYHAPSWAGDQFDNKLISMYTRLDKSTFNGEGYSRYDSWDRMHTRCILCWAQTRILDSYLDMYIATEELQWLHTFQKQARKITEITDDKLGRKDYRGISGPAWSTIHYSKGTPHVWVVHTGSICNALLRFVTIVRERRLLQFEKNADAFLSLAIKSVAYHDDQYKVSGKLAGYWERSDAPHKLAGQYLPWNQQTEIGRTLLFLWQLTRIESYRNRAKKIGQTLANTIVINKNGGYCYWPYWTKTLKKTGRVDDINHASMVMRFMVDMNKEGLIFRDGSLKCVAKSILNRVIQKDGKVSKLLDGKGNKSFSPLIFLWLPLGSVEPEIYYAIKNLYVNHPILLEMSHMMRPDYRGVAFQAIASMLVQYKMHEL